MVEAANEFLGFFLDEALDVLSVWERSCLALEKDGSAEAKEELYRAAHNLKGGSGAVGLSDFNHVVHKVEDLIQKILNGQLQPNPSIIKVLLGAHSLLVQWIRQLKDGASFSAEPEIQLVLQEVAALLGGSSSGIESPPASEGLTELSEAALEALLEQQVASASAAELPPAPPSPRPSETPKLQSPTSKSQSESIRVASSKLDLIIQLIGELSTQQAIVWHARQNGQMQSPSCDNAIQLIQKIAKDLQGQALSLRLQTLQNLFQRLERSASDVARSQQKKIEVQLTGEHVELDRTVIERMSDAMNHVIRNAVDHGVEAPEDRLAAGKSEAATLRIVAQQETNGVLITISDDGRGLASEKILKKAVERGLVRPEAQLSEGEIHRLIFHAGLSTAEKLSDISGRGVGMDVVKNAVETIGGTIEVSSQARRGTSFAITLPATLSIIDALVIAVDGERYAVPIQDVAEIIDQASARIEPVAGFGSILSLRQELIPLEVLRQHLPEAVELPEGTIPVGGQSIRPALVVRRGDVSLAFAVDGVLGQQPLSVRPLPPALAQIPGYGGGSILGNGDPCVILNLGALVNRYYESRTAAKGRAERRDLATAAASPALSGIENRFLVFELGAHTLGAPLLSIKEVLKGQRCEPRLGAAPHVRGSLELRGQLLPVYELARILGLTPAPETSDTSDLVLEDSTGLFALRVERVLAVAALELLPGHTAAMPDALIGSAHFAGRTLTLLDLQRALRVWETNSAGTPAPSSLIAPVLEVS